MDSTRFSSLREKRVLLQNDVTMTSQVGATYLKRWGLVSQIQRCLHWLPS